MLGNKENLETVSIFPFLCSVIVFYILLFCQLHIARCGDKTRGCKSTVTSLVVDTNYKTRILYHSNIKLFSINLIADAYKFYNIYSEFF